MLLCFTADERLQNFFPLWLKHNRSFTASPNIFSTVFYPFQGFNRTNEIRFLFERIKTLQHYLFMFRFHAYRIRCGLQKMHLQWKFFYVDLLIHFSSDVLWTEFHFFVLKFWRFEGLFIFESKCSEITNVQSTLFLWWYAHPALKTWIPIEFTQNYSKIHITKSCLTFFDHVAIWAQNNVLKFVALNTTFVAFISTVAHGAHQIFLWHWSFTDYSPKFSNCALACLQNNEYSLMFLLKLSRIFLQRLKSHVFVCLQIYGINIAVIGEYNLAYYSYQNRFP